MLGRLAGDVIMPMTRLEHTAARPCEHPRALWEVNAQPELVRLREGARVTLRPARADDEPALRIFLTDLCSEARRLRFFSGAADTASAAHAAASTGGGRFGLVVHDESGALVAHALCAQLDRTRAEVAVEVADHLHGRGLGTILIERLAAVAEQRGITQLVAEVLPDNREMLGVFRDSFDAHVSFREGIEAITFPTSAWLTASKRFPEEGTR